MGDEPLQEAGDLMDVIVSVLVKILCGMNRNQRGAVCTCCQPETKINTTCACQCAYIRTIYKYVAFAHVNMLESN